MRYRNSKDFNSFWAEFKNIPKRISKTGWTKYTAFMLCRMTVTSNRAEKGEKGKTWVKARTCVRFFLHFVIRLEQNQQGRSFRLKIRSTNYFFLLNSRITFKNWWVNPSVYRDYSLSIKPWLVQIHVSYSLHLFILLLFG